MYIQTDSKTFDLQKLDNGIIQKRIIKARRNVNKQSNSR